MKRRLAPLILTVPLLLSACGPADDTSDTAATEPPTTEAATTTAEHEIHALSDTVTIGNGVIISNMETTTEGCEFHAPPTRDAVKFQILATVENTTDQDILEVLWPTEISFTDPDGFSVSTLDVTAPGEGPCSNGNPTEFNSMSAGEKRRAAITVEAPAGAQEMIYNTTLIDGAEPVRWDVTEEIEGMEVASPAAATTPEAAPSSTQEPTSAEDPVIGMTEAPGAADPSAMNKTIQSCGEAHLHQLGTTFFTDGTSGWTQQCADQMQPAVDALIQQQAPPVEDYSREWAGEFVPAPSQ